MEARGERTATVHLSLSLSFVLVFWNAFNALCTDEERLREGERERENRPTVSLFSYRREVGAGNKMEEGKEGKNQGRK